jgi:hypothetical protein
MLSKRHELTPFNLVTGEVCRLTVLTEDG